VNKTVPILSIVTWLGGILIITRGPFNDIGWFMGRYDPSVLIYHVCGIALAVVAGIGDFRWARLASLTFSVPAALWYLLGFFALLGWSLHPDELRPGAPLFLWIVSYMVVLLMICMPVFWAVPCYKMSTRGLTKR